MAVDTAQKRFSMLAFDQLDELVFQIDGTVDADDRSMLLGLYSGIALASPSLVWPFKKTLSAVGTKVGKRQPHRSAVKG